MKTTLRASLLVLPSLILTLAPAARPAFADESGPLPSPARGEVITTSNATAGNALLIFDRDASGGLTAAGSVSTGGTGTGAGLGSQGALARDGEWLFAVNAGSSDISVFSLAGGTPALVSRTPSGGAGPISVTAHDGLVYVLNATAPANVTGFFVDARGALHAIPGSTQPLSAENAGPAEVAFAPSGDDLVVTEKTTNRVDVFPVDWQGRARPAVVTPSAGAEPFGFAFTPRGVLVVSEAQEGDAGGATVSSYDISRGGPAHVVSAAVPDGQTAACWLITDEDGRYAFTANAGSGNLSAYRVGEQGELTLDGVSVSTGAGSHPIDLAVTRRAPFLYALTSGNGAVQGYEVGGGALADVGSVSGLPLSAAGLVAW